MHMGDGAWYAGQAFCVAKPRPDKPWKLLRKDGEKGLRAMAIMGFNLHAHDFDRTSGWSVFVAA